MPTTLRKSADPLAAKADLRGGCVASPPALAGPAAAVDAALGGVVARAVKDGEIDGKARSSTVFHAASGLAAPRVAVVGTGGGGAEDWRAAGSAAAGAAATARARSVAIAPPPEAGEAEVAALLEGFGTGIYRFDRYKTTARGAARPLAAWKRVDERAFPSISPSLTARATTPPRAASTAAAGPARAGGEATHTTRRSALAASGSADFRSVVGMGLSGCRGTPEAYAGCVRLDRP